MAVLVVQELLALLVELLFVSMSSWFRCPLLSILSWFRCSLLSMLSWFSSGFFSFMLSCFSSGFFSFMLLCNCSVFTYSCYYFRILSDGWMV